jgi:catechol 2,3-dioxygenase-like lactoylglutathione lyase family enzyme
MSPLQPRTLDHVAFWVAERDPIAERCIDWFGMHVIDRQESFTLLGADARHGKLTLFDAPGPREPGVFRHVGFRVADLAAARARLPHGTPELFDLGEGILVRLVEGDTDIAIDLDHVLLASPDLARAAAGYERLGLSRLGDARLEVGGAFVELEPGGRLETARPLLNHLALLVDSADAHRREAERAGIEIESVVDAANTLAVFVWGPDRLRIEYVEHKPTFSLV